LETLLSPPIMLEGRVGVVKAATVRFHDQTSIPPEEIWLERAGPDAERDVDLGSRQSCARAHTQEQSLQLTAGSLGVRMDLVEQHAQTSHATPAPASLNQTAQAGVIEQAQHLRLGERLPQFPDWDNGREIQERPCQAGAGNPVERRSIVTCQAMVPMRVDTIRNSSATPGGGHIDRCAIVVAYAPKRSCRPMRKHSVRATRKDSRHSSPIQVHARVSDRIDAMVDSV
jgi:hypothetical protein